MQVWDAEGNEVPQHQWQDVDISGDVFTDGSCDQNWIKDLRRAAWAFVTLGTDGKPKHTVMCSVPADQLQTPQSAEYGAVAGLASWSTGNVAAWSDCLGVVNAWNHWTSMWHCRDRAHAGLIAEARKADPQHIKSLDWVKAHQSEGTTVSASAGSVPNGVSN